MNQGWRVEARRGGWLIAICVSLLTVSAAASAAKRPTPLGRGRLAVEQGYNDNVQQKQGPARQSDFFTTVSGFLRWEDPRARRGLRPAEVTLKIHDREYAALRQFSYFEVQPEGAFAITRDADLVLTYLFSPERILFDEDQERPSYTEHAFTGGLRVAFGAANQGRTQFLFAGVWDTFHGTATDRTAFTPGIAADIRYRFAAPWLPGLGVVPRLGVEYGARKARRDNFNRDVVLVTPGLVLALPRGLAWRFQYERSWRLYSVDTARDTLAQRSNPNFEREDRIEQFHQWLTLPVPVGTGVALGLRYRFRAGVFNVPNRKQPDGRLGVRETFDVHELGVEVSYAF